MAGCAKPRVVDADQLQDRNGIAYLPNEEKPFTGFAVAKYPNGQKKKEVTYKDGKKISEKEWDEDGNPK